MHRLDIGAETGAHNPRVLLLAPSVGFGGGVEHHLAALDERLRAGGALVHRIDLHVPARPADPWARERFAAAAVRAAARLAPLDAVLTGWPGLIPVAAAAVAAGRAARGPVLLYGADGLRARPLRRALLSRHRRLFPVATGSYSAGALAGLGAVPVLRPGVPAAWRAALLAAGARPARDGATRPPALLTILPPAADRGLLTAAPGGGADRGAADRGAAGGADGLSAVLAALATARRAVGPTRLVVAAAGPVPAAVRAAVAAAGGAELVESADDARLAGLYAEADLFVPCGQTGPGRGVDGLIRLLTEAQLAGCPVIGPVRGDARDAYVDGATGATPNDESAAALAAAVTGLLTDRARLARMRRRAAEWARMATDPDERTRAVFAAVLGTGPAGPAPAATSPGTASAGAVGSGALDGRGASGPGVAAVGPGERTGPSRAGAGASTPAGNATRPASRRLPTQVWPEPTETGPGPLRSAPRGSRAGWAAGADRDYAEASRGWSDDIEVDDLYIR